MTWMKISGHSVKEPAPLSSIHLYQYPPDCLHWVAHFTWIIFGSTSRSGWWEKRSQQLTHRISFWFHLAPSSHLYTSLALIRNHWVSLIVFGHAPLHWVFVKSLWMTARLIPWQERLVWSNLSSHSLLGARLSSTLLDHACRALPCHWRFWSS